ncbi:MAG: protein kinase [Actinomycetia bacterium]|nr:protein kinase [Actinomycetes bacterium]
MHWATPIQQGILHRDIKPENILVGTEQTTTTKLADFGISSIREATATQAIAYSMAHSPPETFSVGTDERDGRSDLYSLASTLYTLIAGEPHTTVTITTTPSWPTSSVSPNIRSQPLKPDPQSSTGSCSKHWPRTPTIDLPQPPTSPRNWQRS